MPEEEVVKVRRLTRWQRIGIAALFVLGALLIGGAVFIVSGVYNIGAARDHWSATSFLIGVLRDRSIAVASSGTRVPDLADPDLYRLGAEHYRGGCITCHGTPGEPLNPIYRNMLPQPPDLSGAFDDYDAREVHWIVNHGLKYTGMPAWPGAGRPDEVWALVAYLAFLHGQQPRPSNGRLLAPEDDPAVAGEAVPEDCVRCHGDAATPRISELVPRLDGLSPDYLARALREFRDEIRASGIMAPIAHELTEEEIAGFAQYYASASADEPPPDPGPDVLALGREVAERGVPEQDVPACLACHNGTNPQIPALEGQSARYMANQLELWRSSDYRSDSAYGSLMSVIGKRLSSEQASAVSAYLAGLPPASEARP